MTNLKLAARIGLVLVCGAGAAAHADTIAEWNFGTLSSTAPDNTPAATNGTRATNSATTGSSVGMANTYAEASYAGGSPYTFDDITNDTNSTIGNGNVWRLRGSSTQSTQSGANGWSINAPQYAQGAQFTTTTAGYDNISLSFSWASTAQGIANMQVQYNTINFGALGITSVNNDASFGVRLGPRPYVCWSRDWAAWVHWPASARPSKYPPQPRAICRHLATRLESSPRRASYNGNTQASQA